jgi:hypothetical protein
MIRVPKNIIIEAKYTIGNEFIILPSYQEYQGYYYEMNGKFFAGKLFNEIAPQLNKIDVLKMNNLLNKPSTFLYGNLSKIKLNNSNIPSYIFQPSKDDYDKGYSIRYFYNKNNVTPTIIREINKETHDNLINNPLYHIISIKWYISFDNDLDKAEKQMPGFKAFLGF